MRYPFLAYLLFLGFFFGFTADLKGQIDSLERALRQTDEPSVKMALHNEIAYQYHPTDSGRAYHHATEALSLSHQLNDAYGSGRAFKNLALTEAYLGYAEKAIVLYDSAYHYFSSIPDSRIV